MQVDARALALTLIRETSLPGVAGGLVAGLAQSRSVVLARVWFLDAMGGALTLAGSAGTPSGGGSYRRLDGEFRQFALNDARILDIATTRQPVVLRGIRGDEEWLNASWASRQGVRGFVALPLVAGTVVTGVVALFDRELPDDRTLTDLQFVTDVAAARAAELGARHTTRTSTEVVTRAELRQLERQNIEAALVQTGGKVFGPTGAAAVLEMKPTTLVSRIKTLGISRENH